MRDSLETCTILTPFPYALRESFLRVGLWNNSQPTPILPLSFSIAISISPSPAHCPPLFLSLFPSPSPSLNISSQSTIVQTPPELAHKESTGFSQASPHPSCLAALMLCSWNGLPHHLWHIQLPPLEVMIHSLLRYLVSASPSLTDSWLHLPRSSDVCTSSWIVPCVYLDVRMSCRSYKT